jgi:Ser/Thr protein kinase RdoA (MazF antagonist)
MVALSSDTIPDASVAGVMAAVARGEAEVFDGRGVNTSYRVGRLSVKVHHPATSSELVADRLRLVDRALRGASWYPPIRDLGLHGGRDPSLVVVRPFAEGRPSEDDHRQVRELAGVLRDLTARAVDVEVDEALVDDYASPWLTCADRELAGTAGVLADRPDLARTIETHLDDLLASARRVSGPDLAVHHGDLHGRNLILGSGRCTVIDWDEAGFSRRPADAAKALWLSSRRARGDFDLLPAAVRRFLCLVPAADPLDLARLGALWFLPTPGHVTLLGERDASRSHVPWYLAWVSRFWSRWERNLDVIAEVAEQRA